MQTLVAQTLSSITLGPPVSCDSLTMFPLLGPPSVEQAPSYLTLDQAIGDAWTEITEVSEQGSVPELRVVNKSAQPVFILDGEELVGAKQNRVVNLSILVPELATLTIPVSCVEAGRWRSRSRAFSSAPRTQYAGGRAKRMAQVTESIQARGARDSDQAEVWADIAAKCERMSAHSSTGAMEEIFLRHDDFTQRCVDTLNPVAQQCGALFLIDERIVGFDLFDRAITLRRLLPKLVRSVAVDAIDSSYGGPGGNGGRKPASSVLTKLADRFLETTSGAAVHQGDAIGMGRDMRFVDPRITGAALATGGSLVHLCAFHL